MERFINKNLAEIVEAREENFKKNFEVHVETQPMRKNAGKDPIGMESHTSSHFKQYFNNKSQQNSIESRERNEQFQQNRFDDRHSGFHARVDNQLRPLPFSAL